MIKTFQIILLSFSLGLLNTLHAQSLNVEKTDNTLNSFSLSNIKTITFNEYNMIVLPKSGISTKTALGNISKLYFDTKVVSEIATFNNEVYIASPNPFSNELYTTIPDNATSYILDVFGKKQNIEVLNGVTNTSNLESGCYFLVIEQNNKREIVKLLKL